MRRRIFTTLMIAASVAACSKDIVATQGAKTPSAASAPGGTDTSTTGSPATPPAPPEPTSNEPVATVELSPKTLTLSIGYYGHIDAIARDANGVRVANKKATWTSDDASIVVASDTGVMYGKAIGSTTARATIDGHTASASITVSAAPPRPPAPTPVPGVAKFNLTATVVGFAVGPDTSHTDPVAGAIVHLMRVTGASYDTLATPVDAGTATSDAHGSISFANLDGGGYTFSITPPAGSPYRSVSGGFGPPQVTDFRLNLSVPRK